MKSFPHPTPQALSHESLSLSFLSVGCAEPEVNIKGASWNLGETEEGHGQDQVVPGGGVAALPFPTWDFMPQRAKDCSFPECFFFKPLLTLSFLPKLEPVTSDESSPFRSLFPLLTVPDSRRYELQGILSPLFLLGFPLDGLFASVFNLPHETYKGGESHVADTSH